MEERKFTRDDTLFAKGIATFLLLIHHLFYQRMDIGPFINGASIIYEIAQISKVCVAIFLILSGFGLNESSRDVKKSNLIGFYASRVAKLLLNYWFILILFIPIGVFGFGRTIQFVYGKDSILKLLINISGLQMIIGTPSYNDTWWFISLIIILYLLFPFIQTIIQKYKAFGLALFLLLTVLPIENTTRINITFIMDYIFPFALGIFLSNENIFARISSAISNSSFCGRMTIGLLYILSFVAVVSIRQRASFFSGIRIDGVLGFLIISIGYNYLSKGKIFRAAMIQFGRDSMDIFLFHTFICCDFLSSIVYFTQNFLVILLSMLAFTMIIAKVVEGLKKATRFNIFQAFLIRQIKGNIKTTT